MGITIHYAGKAKSLAAIGELINAMTGRARIMGWRTSLVNRDVIGRFYPNWGIGYGFIPSEDMIKESKIEFFPNMVSSDCNGYFRIIDTPFAESYREAFRKGRYPTFKIDTHVKGIILYPHEKCEPLEFVFDLNSLELASYQIADDKPGVIYGYNSCWSKTQCAGFKTHVLVCETIRLAEKYVDFSKIKDEAEYYHTRDLLVGIKNFNELKFSIRNFGKLLNDVAKKHGLSAKSGDEI
ncbi:MAG TPA: hypothetical protein VLX91_05700 [Candidatus Acidoferrales bacterium]|nr:hypothetical protein [Candidatus Acidoferrales bacterium]